MSFKVKINLVLSPIIILLLTSLVFIHIYCLAPKVEPLSRATKIGGYIILGIAVCATYLLPAIGIIGDAYRKFRGEKTTVEPFVLWILFVIGLICLQLLLATIKNKANWVYVLFD